MTSQPDFLDQGQVDAVLGVPVEEKPADRSAVEAQPYRFTVPTRSRGPAEDGSRALKETFGRHLRERLTFRLRKPTGVTPGDTETISFSELTLALGGPSAAFSFPVGKEEGQRAVFDWSISTAFVLVDRLLGGPGSPFPKARPLTGIEQALLRRLTAEVLGLLREAASELFAVDPAQIRYEPRLPGSRLAESSDRFTAMTWRIHIERFEGIATLAVPAALLGAHGPSASPETRAVAGNDDTTLVRTLGESTVLTSRVSVSVRLPLLSLLMGEIGALEPGRVIDTGHPAQNPVRVLVNGRRLFDASVGQSQGRFAVRIVDVARTATAERLSNAKQGRVL